jgi:hypothetical protein
VGLYFKGVPDWLCAWAAQVPGVELAVETGTFRGDSADQLAKTFGRCITIERDPSLGAAAIARFADRSDVDVRVGSSREILPEVCAALDQSAFFWLDGHWSGDVTAGEDDPCPLMEELAAVGSSPAVARHIVAIDDMRLFGSGHSLDREMKHFPRLHEVLDVLERMHLNTFAIDDVVVGVPERSAESFMALGASSDVRQSVLIFPYWNDILRARADRERRKERRTPSRLKRTISRGLAPIRSRG